MPKVYAIIMKYVKIVSARVEYEHIDPFNTYLWKQMAFQNLWRENGLLN